jgi:tetratricopeptide (TPR) repeat protein
MVDHSRIDALRRRVLADPASVAFAALAEEYRRAGLLTEAVEACRTGLAQHPEYVSARVTLARALSALGDTDAAVAEFTRVIEIAPENLAAQRDLAELYLRRGESAAALDRYRVAAALAPQDAGIREAVLGLERRIGGLEAPAVVGLIVPFPPASARPARPDEGTTPQAGARPGPALHLVSDADLPGEWRFVDAETAVRQVRALEQFLALIQHARGPQPVQAANG